MFSVDRAFLVRVITNPAHPAPFSFWRRLGDALEIKPEEASALLVAWADSHYLRARKEDSATRRWGAA
jgi:hypothetical protein